MKPIDKITAGLKEVKEHREGKIDLKTTKRLDIKKARFCLEMTQSEFAKKLDVAQNTVSQWETGQRNPPKLVIREIERMLNEVQE